MSKKTYYPSKIKQALQYINEHLDEDIQMGKLAELSHFSLFHFQRIFKAITGESPYESLLRLRLEKSVFLLKYAAKLSISEIAYESGFPSPENFSRQFKNRYKISPSAFRKDKTLHNSKIYQEHHPKDFYLRIEHSRKIASEDFTVVIEELPEIPIAISKAVFGSDGSGMIEKYFDLIAWAEKNEIAYKGYELKRFGMSIDNPEVTPASKFRYDFALSIDKTYPKDDLIEFGAIPKASYATVHAIGSLETVAQAWDFLYKKWLPESDYLPLHYPAIEEFIKGPEEIAWEQFDLKCRIPITKLK